MTIIERPPTKASIEDHKMSAKYTCIAYFTDADIPFPLGFVLPKGHVSGWALRKLIKEWCQENDIEDYIIYRKKDYHKDLISFWYELYVIKEETKK